MTSTLKPILGLRKKAEDVEFCSLWSLFKTICKSQFHFIKKSFPVDDLD